MKKSILLGVLSALLVVCALSIDCVKSDQQVKDGQAVVACIRQHWGEPWQKLVSDCAQNELAAFIDLVTDIQLLFEKQGGSATTFPYGEEPQVATRLAAKRTTR